MITQLVELNDYIYPGKQEIKSMLGIPQNKKLTYSRLKNSLLVQAKSLHNGIYYSDKHTFIKVNSFVHELLVNELPWTPINRPILQTKLDI
jgi:hypothetical protein